MAGNKKEGETFPLFSVAALEDLGASRANGCCSSPCLTIWLSRSLRRSRYISRRRRISRNRKTFLRTCGLCILDNSYGHPPGKLTASKYHWLLQYACQSGKKTWPLSIVSLFCLYSGGLLNSKNTLLVLFNRFSHFQGIPATHWAGKTSIS